MSKLILYLFLIVFASGLRAQTTPPEACIWKSAWTPFGTGTEWRHGKSEAQGVRVAWWAYWCPQKDGSWSLTQQRCVIGRGCIDTAAATSILDTAARSSDPLVALQEARQLYQLPVQPNELPAWDKAWADLHAAAEAIKPAAVAWVVAAATASDGTRPAYPFANGVRGTASNGRALAGQPCDLAKGSAPTAGSGTWAVFGPAFDPSRVALCVKKP